VILNTEEIPWNLAMDTDSRFVTFACSTTCGIERFVFVPVAAQSFFLFLVMMASSQPKLMCRLQLLIILLFSLITTTNGQRTRKEARNHFRDTLLVIKYNLKASIQAILLHHSLWRRAFKNQLIVVQWTQAEINNYRQIYGLSDSEYRISMIPEKSWENGYFAYDALTTAMISYPHFAGYLYVHDDMALNVSKLMDLDMNNLWVTAESQCIPNLDWVNKTNGWCWWNSKFGVENIQNFLSSRTDLAMELKECLGSEKTWCFGQSDFFCVPQNLKDSTLRVLTAYRAYDIFIEIAMPTFHNCYVLKNRTEELTLCTTWGSSRNNYTFLYDNCKNRDFSLFHPVKLTSSVNIAGMVETMSLVDKSHLAPSNDHL
jgi:hypothetical protein